MRTLGAILTSSPGKWQVVELDLDAPRQGELMVKLAAAGLCQPDAHMATGDLIFGTYPFCGGHEGAGVVVQVGPETHGFGEGDHVVLSFLPACGRCRWCARGLQNLCDLGAGTLLRSRIGDPTSMRMRLSDGTPVGQMNGISTFAEYTTVHQESAVKIDGYLPLDRIALPVCGGGTRGGPAADLAADPARQAAHWTR